MDDYDPDLLFTFKAQNDDEAEFISEQKYEKIENGKAYRIYRITGKDFRKNFAAPLRFIKAVISANFKDEGMKVFNKIWKIIPDTEIKRKENM